MRTLAITLLFAFCSTIGFASDVGTATPELCKSKNMAYVKEQTRTSAKGKVYKVRAHCRKTTKSIKAQ